MESEEDDSFAFLELIDKEKDSVTGKVLKKLGKEKSTAVRNVSIFQQKMW